MESSTFSSLEADTNPLAYLACSVGIDYFEIQYLDILLLYVNSIEQIVLLLLAFRIGNNYKRWSSSMFA